MNVFRRTTGREREAVSGYSRRINALAFSGRCTVTIMEKRIQEMPCTAPCTESMVGRQPGIVRQ